MNSVSFFIFSEKESNKMGNWMMVKGCIPLRCGSFQLPRELLFFAHDANLTVPLTEPMSFDWIFVYNIFIAFSSQVHTGLL